MAVVESASALAYARDIAETLGQLAEITGEYGDDVTSDSLRDTAEQYRDDDDIDSATTADRAAELLDSLGLGDDSDGVTVWERYIGTALETTVTGTRSAGSNVWETDTVKLLVSFGGPNLWIIAGHAPGVVIECYWGSDSAVVRCPDMVDLGAALWGRSEQ